MSKTLTLTLVVTDEVAAQETADNIFKWWDGKTPVSGDNLHLHLYQKT